MNSGEVTKATLVVTKATSADTGYLPNAKLSKSLIEDILNDDDLLT